MPWIKETFRYWDIVWKKWKDPQELTSKLRQKKEKKNPAIQISEEKYFVQGVQEAYMLQGDRCLPDTFEKGQSTETEDGS